MNTEQCRVLDVNCALLGVDANARRVCTFTGRRVEEMTNCPIGEAVVKRSQLPRFRIIDLVQLGIRDARAFTIDAGISPSYDRIPK